MTELYQPLDIAGRVPVMSQIFDRRPEVKIHLSLAKAKASFNTGKYNLGLPQKPLKPGYGWKTTEITHSWGFIFIYKDDDWQLLYTIPKPTADDVIFRLTKTGGKMEYETRPWILEKKDFHLRKDVPLDRLREFGLS